MDKRKFEIIPNWKLTPELIEWVVECYDDAIYLTENNCKVNEKMKRDKERFLNGSVEYQRAEIEESCLDIANDDAEIFDDSEYIQQVVQEVSK